MLASGVHGNADRRIIYMRYDRKKGAWIKKHKDVPLPSMLWMEGTDNASSLGWLKRRRTTPKKKKNKKSAITFEKSELKLPRVMDVGEGLSLSIVSNRKRKISVELNERGAKKSKVDEDERKFNPKNGNSNGNISDEFKMDESKAREDKMFIDHKLLEGGKSLGMCWPTIVCDSSDTSNGIDDDLEDLKRKLAECDEDIRVSKDSIYTNGDCTTLNHLDSSYEDIIANMHNIYLENLDRLCSREYLEKLWLDIRSGSNVDFAHLNEVSDKWGEIVKLLVEPLLRSMGDKLQIFQDRRENIKLAMENESSDIRECDKDGAKATLVKPMKPKAVKPKLRKPSINRLANVMAAFNNMLFRLMSDNVSLNSIQMVYRQCHMCRKQGKCSHSMVKQKKNDSARCRQKKTARARVSAVGKKESSYSRYFFGVGCSGDGFGKGCGEKMVKLMELLQCARSVHAYSNNRDAANEQMDSEALDDTIVAVVDGYDKITKVEFAKRMSEILRKFDGAERNDVRYGPMPRTNVDKRSRGYNKVL